MSNDEIKTSELVRMPLPQPKPEPELGPKPKLVTWRWCVRIEPLEIGSRTFLAEWFPSGNIPEHWYPVESYTQPIETVKLLPEGQQP